MLLLPDPRRDTRLLANDLPVPRAKRYLVTRIGFGPATSFADAVERVEFHPNYVEVANEAHVELIGVESRVRRIAGVYAALGLQHPTVASRLAAHRDFLAAGGPVTHELTSLVTAVTKALAAADASYPGDIDPLPALERIAGIVPPPGPELPSPDEIGEDEIEVRAAAAQDYRLARARGASAKRFSLAVRKAYGHRCAFCGMVLGGIPGVVPGIDAAHILAWSAYDLDVVPNGIALCKTHHWAFDAGLMVPALYGSAYSVRFTSLATRFDPDTLNILGADGWRIPDDWLPAEPALRPSKKYLRRLYEDLSVELLS